MPHLCGNRARNTLSCALSIESLLGAPLLAPPLVDMCAPNFITLAVCPKETTIQSHPLEGASQDASLPHKCANPPYTALSRATPNPTPQPLPSPVPSDVPIPRPTQAPPVVSP